jgi:hypothetical protein
MEVGKRAFGVLDFLFSDGFVDYQSIVWVGDEVDMLL